MRFDQTPDYARGLVSVDPSAAGVCLGVNFRRPSDFRVGDPRYAQAVRCRNAMARAAAYRGLPYPAPAARHPMTSVVPSDVATQAGPPTTASEERWSAPWAGGSPMMPAFGTMPAVPPAPRGALGYVGTQMNGARVSSAVPYAGVGQTMDLIRAQADRWAHSMQLREVAERTTRGLYGKDYLSEAAALYYWSCNPQNRRYMRDPARVELVKDAEAISRTKQIDCDEFDVDLGSALRWQRAARLGGLQSVAGAPSVEMVVVAFGDPGIGSHTFVRMPDPRGGNRRLVLDPVAGPVTGAMLRNVRSVRAAKLI